MPLLATLQKGPHGRHNLQKESVMMGLVVGFITHYAGFLVGVSEFPLGGYFSFQFTKPCSSTYTILHDSNVNAFVGIKHLTEKYF